MISPRIRLDPSSGILALLLLLGVGTSAAAQEVDVWSRPLQAERSRSVDFLHYRVALNVDLDKKTFQGKNRITLTPLTDGVERFALDAEDMVIEGVRNGRGEELSFERGDTSLIVALPRPLRFGDTTDIVVTYRGQDSRDGFFFDDEAEDHPRMVSTDSWPDEAHGWIPLYDYPNDRVTHELIVTVPVGNKVLSNGRLVGVTEDRAAGTSTWHWSQEQPHATYLFMMAIGPFAVLEDSLADLPVNYWVYPGAEGDARWIFEKTPRMIEFYGDLFDYPYPWAKYDQVTTPHVGGGAEATSATLLGQNVIHDRRAEQDFSWERIIAHEIAHQWWGDLITLREWSHTWLNESFATYSDYLWTRAEKGEDEGAWDLLEKKKQYLTEARDRYMRPIVFPRYEKPHDNFDAHTYPKGAVILHQLRRLLGDEAFFRTLSTFLHQHAFGSVDTHDFTKTVKEVTGRNMDWFFEQYLFRPGHPVFRVSWEWDETVGEIRLEVAQVQPRDHGVPIYRTPVDIGISTSSGKRVERVWLEEERHVFSLPSPERPLLVRFDEGNWLLKELSFSKSLEELVYQAQRDDVIGREWAVRELAAFGDRPGVPGALSAVVRRDPFWAVRLAAVEVLSQVHPEASVALFREAATDESSRVRRAAVGALGQLGAPGQIPFLKERFTTDDSYQVQAEALRAIGRVGDRGQLSFLREAAGQPSHQDVVRRAAEWAIQMIEGGDGGVS